MVWFLQKREILEYCGKDGKAVRWLENQIRDGLIIHDLDRGYIKVGEYWQEAYDEAKRRFNEKLDKIENKSESEQSEELNAKNFEDAATILELKGKIEELESDLEYVNKEYEKMEEELDKYQEAIRNCYRWARDVKKDKTARSTFKKDILKLELDIKGEDNQ